MFDCHTPFMLTDFQSVAASVRQASVAASAQVKIEEQESSIALDTIAEEWDQPSWPHIDVDSDVEHKNAPPPMERPNHWPILDFGRSFVVSTTSIFNERCTEHIGEGSRRRTYGEHWSCRSSETNADTSSPGTLRDRL